MNTLIKSFLELDKNISWKDIYQFSYKWKDWKVFYLQYFKHWKDYVWESPDLIPWIDNSSKSFRYKKDLVKYLKTLMNKTWFKDKSESRLNSELAFKATFDKWTEWPHSEKISFVTIEKVIKDTVDELDFSLDPQTEVKNNEKIPNNHHFEIKFFANNFWEDDYKTFKKTLTQNLELEDIDYLNSTLILHNWDIEFKNSWLVVTITGEIIILN